MELEEMKAEVYDAWAVMNRSFEQIINAFDRLEKKGILRSDYVHHQSVVTNDLWAKLNCHILRAVGEREHDDRTHYGKMKANLKKASKR